MTVHVLTSGPVLVEVLKKWHREQATLMVAMGPVVCGVILNRWRN